MNNYTNRQIEEQLKQLQSIRPGAESLERMNRQVRRIITDAGQTPATSYGLWYYAVASAAILLIGIGLLYHVEPIPDRLAGFGNALPEQPLTLAKLNAVFNSGGQQALNKYFETVESQRQPRAESVTLQEMLKEL